MEQRYGFIPKPSKPFSLDVHAEVTRKDTMHYKNGREAKNGDKIVLIDLSYNTLKLGILYDATAGNDFCNGKIAPISNGDACPNLKECLHYDDFLAALPEEVKARAK